MEEVYKRQTMDIIHYMVSKLEGMDLFETPFNNNPNYTETRNAQMVDDDSEDDETEEIGDQETGKLSLFECVQFSILEEKSEFRNPGIKNDESRNTLTPFTVT